MTTAPFDPNILPICLRTRFACERGMAVPLHMWPVYEADSVTGELKFTGDFLRRPPPPPSDTPP